MHSLGSTTYHTRVFGDRLAHLVQIDFLCSRIERHTFQLDFQVRACLGHFCLLANTNVNRVTLLMAGCAVIGMTLDETSQSISNSNAHLKNRRTFLSSVIQGGVLQTQYRMTVK